MTTSSPDPTLEKILGHFRALSAIPRRSRDEARAIAFVRDWAARHGFASRQDATGNVVIEVPASPGAELAPEVAIQGHLDMVCEKTPDSPHDFTRDPITLIETDGWLHADRTTLGADNGIAIAMAMALAEDPQAIHPPLELLFTVDEETGLTGALGLEPGFVGARTLINLDSEDDTALTIGCAGGAGLEIAFELGSTAAPAGTLGLELVVGGLTGGHSGVEIHAGRANAIKLLTEALARVAGLPGFALVAIDGGNAHNAIPRDARAQITLTPSAVAETGHVIELIEDEFRARHRNTDPSLKLRLTPLAESPEQVARHATELIELLSALPHGVAELAPDVPGLVQTSNNLAAIHTHGTTALLHSSQRSLSQSGLEAHMQRIAALATAAGASVEVNEGYPPWTPDFDSRLLSRTMAVYRALHGTEPRVEVIHAGLECGIIGAKYPGMEMISLGINIREPHTPQERMQLASVGRCWRLLLGLLETLAKD